MAFEVFSIDTSPNVIHNVHIMKTATIRQLRNDTNTLLNWIEHGETVTITKRRRKVAVLIPPAPTEGIPVPAPDFRSRHKRNFPKDEMHAYNFAEMLQEDKGSY